VKILLKSILDNRIPGQVVIQITDRCNARCPQCGMRASAAFDRSTLATDQIKRIIDAAAARGVQAISFTGGEPLLDMDRLTTLIRHADVAGIPFIRTGTNGFMFANPHKSGFASRVARVVERLAGTGLRNFWISLDSAVDECHERMRGFAGVVAGIERALPIFHRAGIFPAVNLGINRNVGGRATRTLLPAGFSSESAYLASFFRRYRQAFARFYRRAIDLGFTMANTCYPMSIDAPEGGKGLSAVYAATTVADIVRFSAPEKQMLFKALAGAIRQFRAQLRIFSPLCAVEALARQYAPDRAKVPTYGCRGGVDFFFVNAADGGTYPCGYRGNDPLGQLGDLDPRRLRPGREENACRQCDWECFRDPCELCGPLLEIFSDPRNLLQRAAAHPGALRTWASDLLYYRACEWFDGRRPPNFGKLKRFSCRGKADHKTGPLPRTIGQFNQNLSVS
jgi:MoaA/NifB/PqqE/SkfB family radical SAM enzyme